MDLRLTTAHRSTKTGGKQEGICSSDEPYRQSADTRRQHALRETRQRLPSRDASSPRTSTWAWHSVIDSLSQHYTCYAFDMLGHGESDKPQRHFNIPDYANALDHACQVLNIHRGHYVGNSVGAVLATEMAASFPERLDKLVLVGAPVWDARTAPNAWRKRPPATTPTACLSCAPPRS